MYYENKEKKNKQRAPDVEKKKIYLERLDKDYRYSCDKFDHLTIYLSALALGYVMTFAKQEIKCECCCLFTLLYSITLISFSLSLLTGFYGHYYSSEVIRRTMEKVEAGDINYFDSKGDMIIKIFNRISFWAVCLGIIFTLIMAILNQITQS